MIKIHIPELHDGLLEGAGGVLSTSIGEFTGARIKEASNNCITEQMLRDAKPDKDNVLIHLIALGDYEKFGTNRNHDAYDKEANSTRCKTFETHAQVYQEHRNRDPEKNIGTVKIARYNPEMSRVELAVWLNRHKAPQEFEMAKQGKQLSWSMSCFPAGTLVEMADGTEKPIEQISVGDKVRTHHGNTGDVSHTMQRDYDGVGISLRAYGLPDDIQCTPDHGIWVRPHKKHVHECPVCGENFAQLASHLWQKKDAQHQYAYRNLAKEAEGFKRADQILPGDFVRTPILKGTNENGSEALAKILGYYLAEGCYSPYKQRKTVNGKHYAYDRVRVDFTFSIDEVHLENDLIDSIKKAGFTGNIYTFQIPERNTRKVRLHDKVFCDFLLKHAGRWSHKKQLSTDVMAWRPAYQKIILEAFIDGDGTYGKIHNTLVYVTTSRVLAFQLMQIAGRNGMGVNLNRFSGSGKKPFYSGTITGCDAINLDSFKHIKPSLLPAAITRNIGHLRHQVDGRTAVYTPAKKQSYIENGFVYHRVRKVKKTYLNEPVYDLTVPGDHGFVVSGVGVSNCKVPHDTCSCCGNKAKSPAQYCDCMKKSAGKWIPEFEKFAFVFNPNPTFFDISEVKHPADRIAHYLSYNFPDSMEKAAAASSAMTGAELAKVYGVRDDNVFDSFEKMAILKRLAQLESDEDPSMRQLVKVAATSGFDTTPLDDGQIDVLRSVYPETLMRKMARLQAPFSFLDFCRYITGDTLSDVQESAGYKKACAMALPKLFSRISADSLPGGLEDLFNPASSYAASRDPNDTDVLDKALEVLQARHGVSANISRPRVLHITVIKQASEQRREVFDAIVVPDEDKYNQLAQAYGVYKVAFCQAVSNLFGADELDDRFYGFILGQNMVQ